MRISDWSSDLCSSDLPNVRQCGKCCQPSAHLLAAATSIRDHTGCRERCEGCEVTRRKAIDNPPVPFGVERKELGAALKKFANLHEDVGFPLAGELVRHRSEEQTSELQSLMRISYA